MPTPRNEDLLHRYETAARQQNAGTPLEVPTSRPWLTAEDALLFAPRGVLDAAKDAYGLLDTVAFDSLPDWEKNPLGESESIVGGLAAGVVNFAAGWIPISGWLGKGGQLLKSARLVKAAETDLPFFRLFAKSASENLTAAGSLAAGALTDLVVFDAQDGRLTDLLATVPGLKAPVDEYLGWLQTNPDDDEVWGRVKNVLEGAGVGGLTHALRLGLRRSAAFAKARAAGKTPEQAMASAERAVSDKELQRAIDDGQLAGDTRGVASHGDALDDLSRLREDPQWNGGGQTFNVDGTRWEAGQEPLDIVSLASTEVPLSKLTPEAMRDFAGRFGRAADDPAVKVGVFNTGRTTDLEEPIFSIDLNAALPSASREANLELARKYGQEAIWDSVKKESVKTGATADLSKSLKPSQDLGAVLRQLREAQAPKAPAVPEATPRAPEGVSVKAPRQQSVYHKLLSPLGYDRAAIERIRTDLEARKAQFGFGTGVERTNPREMDAVELTARALRENSPNFAHIKSSDDVLALGRVIDNLAEEVSPGRNPSLKPQSISKMESEAVQDMAAFAGMANEEADWLRRYAVRAGENNRELAKLMRAVRADRLAFIQFSEDVSKRLSPIIDHPHRWSDEAVVDAAQRIEALANLQMSVRGEGAEIGRGLRFMGAELASPNVPLGTAQEAARVVEAMKTAGGRQRAEALIKKVAVALQRKEGEGALMGPARAAKIARETLGRKFLNATLEYWINALLWNPATWVVNGTSNTLMSMFLAGEKAVGASIMSTTGKAAYNNALREAALELTGLASGVSDAMAFAKATARSGESILDSTVRTLDAARAGERKAITSRNFGIDPESLQGAALDFVGKLIRVPVSIMGGTDELTRQLNYRAVAAARLSVEAAEKGLVGRRAAEYVSRRFELVTRNGQAYARETVLKRGAELARRRGILSPEDVSDFANRYADVHFREDLSALAQYARRRADDASFSARMPTGSLGQTIQLAVQQHPFLRFFMPFVRTPTNILYAAGRRFDAYGVARYVTAQVFPSTAGSLERARSRFVQDMISGDPSRKAEAIGRIASGIAFTSIGMAAATSGLITGRGPSDPDERKLLLDAGWLPYSIKTPEGYISYSRLDPFATVFGTMADLVEAARYAPADRQNDLTVAFNGLLVGLANNVTNKSYLTGIANVIEALQAPDQKAATWARRSVASFVPSGIKSATTAAGDETIRDAQSITDAVLARIPGMSTSVRPSRNVLGEPIRKITAAGTEAITQSMDVVFPFSYRKVSSDSVRRELANLGYGFTPPRPEKYGMDLRNLKNGGKGQDAYDRWGELTGQVQIGGKTIRANLEALIASKRYKSLPPESTSDLDSPRVAEIKRVVQQYREAAWRSLIREYPELADRERNFLRSKRALKSGRDLRDFTATLNRGI